MRKDFEKLFSRLEPIEPPGELLDKILLRIQKQRRRAFIKRRILVFSTAMTLFASAMILSVNLFQTEFSQSSFPQIISLLFSDFNVAVANWREFWLAALESLPAMSFAVSLASLFVLCWSVRTMLKIENQKLRAGNFS